MIKVEKRFVAASLTCALAIGGITCGIVFTNQPEPKVVHRDIPIVMDVTPLDTVSETVTQTSADIREAEAQRIAEEEAARQAQAQQIAVESAPSTPSYSRNSFETDGVWYDDNYRYTWYSSNAAYHYRTPEWTAGSDGIYRDAEGYVVVASSDHPQGTVIENTPFGAVKVYDTGCASGTLDVYTNF